MNFDNFNICKEMAWKVPFENYQVLPPEYYNEKNLQILYKDYVYDKRERRRVYLIDKECNNPIILEKEDFGNISAIPIMFKDLPYASIVTSSEFNKEGFILYGYKNIDESSYFDTSNPKYNTSLKAMIKSLNYIKETIFDLYNDMCIHGLLKEVCYKDKVHESCCGFTAPIFACILNQYLLHYTKYEPLTEDKKILIDMAKSYYKEISSYEDAINSVGIKCTGFSDNRFSENGVYLVAIYDRESYGKDICSTYHHFIVYVHDSFCILIDSWASTKGSRSEWLRIMKTSDLIYILDIIHTTEDINELNVCLNIFFCIPHGNDGNYYPNEEIYKLMSIYTVDDLLSIGSIFLGHNTNGYWYKHAGNVALPSEEWKQFVREQDAEQDAEIVYENTNIFENPYERGKPKLTRKNKKINEFGWKNEWNKGGRRKKRNKSKKNKNKSKSKSKKSKK